MCARSNWTTGPGKTLELLARRLPASTDLYVTAEHAMLAVDLDHAIDYATNRDLQEGVPALAGEARLRVVFTEPDQVEVVLARWRQVLGSRACGMTSDDAVAMGLFGPTVTASARRRLGDIRAICRDRNIIVRRDRERRMSRSLGPHGGLTRDELTVPVLHLRGTHSAEASAAQP